MSSLRPELHVAQQFRRDKLRIQNSSQHLQEFPNNLEQLSLHPGLNLDPLQVRNVRNGNMFDEAIYNSSAMITFSSPSNPLSAHRNPLECHELMMAPYGSTSLPHSSSPKDQQCEPRSLGANWMVNYNESNPNNTLFSSELNNSGSGEMASKEMHYPRSSSSSPPIYHNALQDMTHGVWGGNYAEPLLHYGNEANNELRFGGANLWANSPLGFKKVNEQGPNPHHQGLSLSLSSNSQSKPCFEEGSASDDPQYSKSVKFTTKPNVLSKNTVYRNVGPLGPFTGYATILKSSRFLKPCQQLLDEWCCQSGSNFLKGGVCDVPECVSRGVSAASTSAAGGGGDALNVDENVNATKCGSNSGASSSVIYDSYGNYNNTANNSADDGAASSFCLSSRPEDQKNKAKLLYMQEEVTRRYKQYYQQMQMVVQSFQSVAGLSSATPYVSLALKSVSKHFRCLKNAISDQIRLKCEVLGGDFSVQTTGTSSRFDNMAKLCCMDQSFQKNKSGGANINCLEPQKHVWRPQRGLPERSVAILKAWLFEHFLHPYPTDTDKHMLATQTGLSRNQVSNWFINARVRLWKPMVEEIHMLETKGTTEAHQNSTKNDQGASALEVSNQPKSDNQAVRRFGMHASSSHAIPEKQFQCLEMGSRSSAGNEEPIGMDEDQWNQEKRSKVECQISSTHSMDGTMMGFMPYRRGGLEGLGSVSLTLGLRHGVEGVNQQQLQQQEEELRRHFGGHMIPDLVG